MTLNNDKASSDIIEHKIDILETNNLLECPICFETITQENYIIMDCCLQKIHYKCLYDWALFKKNNLCILCRGKNNIINQLHINNQERNYDSDSESDSNDSMQQNLLNETRNNRRANIIVYRNNFHNCLHMFCLLILFIIIIIIISKNN